MKQAEAAAIAGSNNVPTGAGTSADWVLAEKFEELTGVTPMAIHNRRWLDGKHCAVVARRLYVNIKEADQWIQSQISPRRPA
ncbi:excisionase [Comamonas sp. GB3 AK4-5]|uniref:excisionase n=1 Tax=Comamonas sp. GB3 AK4-5 TaxID=3231487 RepID=UPI00351E231F